MVHAVHSTINAIPRITVLFALVMWGSVSTFTEAAGWKSGVAKSDITPEKSMWMSGYASRDHRSEGTRTPLWCKVVVIEDSSGSRLAAITLDLVGLDRATSNSIRERITKEHAISREGIALYCSHTHCGPVVGHNLMSMYTLSEEDQQLVRDYTGSLIDQVTTTVGQAISDLTPSELGWGSGMIGFAVNRRTNREAEVPPYSPKRELNGPSDHHVPVLQVSSQERVKVILFGYACHATTLDYMQWCGDYPGYAMQQLEEEYPGTVAMFWAGCGADQNPLPRRTGNPDRKVEEATRVELAKRYGGLLATEVQTVLGSNIAPIEGDLAMRYEEVELAYDKVPTAEEVEQQLQSTNKYEVGRARALKQEMASRGSIAPSYPYPIQTWKIGDGPIWVNLGGEVVVDFSIRLKTEIRRLYGGTWPIWVAGYANDVMAYIPSLRVLKEGGYEGEGAMLYYGRPSKWADTIEEKIVTTVYSQVESLLKPAP